MVPGLTVANITSAFSLEAPFLGVWESPMDGYASSAAESGVQGSIDVPTIGGVAIVALGTVSLEGVDTQILVMPDGVLQGFFTSVDITESGGAVRTYTSAGADFYNTGVAVFGLSSSNPGPTWLWRDGNSNFSAGSVTAVSFAGVAPPVPLIEVFGAFANAPAFKPVMLANPGKIGPKVWPVLDNVAARSQG